MMNQRYQYIGPNWTDYSLLTREQLPAEITSWLLDKGSLTDRLVRASQGHFAVQILSQSWQRPKLHESRILGLKPRQLALIREVALLCRGEPWVFARSVLPNQSLVGKYRFLRHFDARPLGALLFNDQQIYRDKFEVARIPASQLPIAKIPIAVSKPQTLLWGRRSRFFLRHRPILVSEIFLPAFSP